MDRRIIRTKKALKGALLDLLKEKEFEAIKTTEICERALVSRNTFYNYYADKYALLADCFSEYETVFEKHFNEKQEQNNANKDVKQGFLNLIDTFFETEQIYAPISILSSFDLAALYYRAIMHILEKYEDRYAGCINPDYDLEALNSFLVLGFWGFIHSGRNRDRKVVQENTRKLVRDLVNSPIFRMPEH